MSLVRYIIYILELLDDRKESTEPKTFLISFFIGSWKWKKDLITQILVTNIDQFQDQLSFVLPYYFTKETVKIFLECSLSKYDYEKGIYFSFFGATS